ncbi:MAG TPA: hypothetical protein VFU07_07125 [Candidatus Lumbricidophila sp.]|nr:hypothetical protein [Candidatus Lumbricidophila sp.]
MSADFDFSELRRFSAALEAGDAALVKNLKTAVGISALKGKRAWQAAAKGGRRLRAYPFSIDYDKVQVTAGAISTELGPNLSRNQGALGIIEDAPGGVRSHPQRNYVEAEKVIESDLVNGVLKAFDDALGGAL